MNSTYTASVVDGAEATATYNTLKGGIAGSSSDLAELSAENYPADNVPLKDSHDHLMPNSANQEIFKNQPISWWASAINAKQVQYRAVSNTVNWTYVTPDGKDIHIRYDISSSIIPNKSNTVSMNTIAGTHTCVFKPTACLNLASVTSMPGAKKTA